MRNRIHHTVTGQPYRAKSQGGRNKSADKKVNVGLRLPKSWLDKIAQHGKNQDFIENAVLNELVRLGSFGNTDTVYT